jgi:hypothetical protein
MSLTKRLMIVVVLALGFTLVAKAACPNKEPRVVGTTVWGGFQHCGDPPVQCPQNYTVNYTRTCVLPSPSNCCVAGPVTVSVVHSYSCNPGCTETITEVPGTDIVKTSCVGNPFCEAGGGGGD